MLFSSSDVSTKENEKVTAFSALAENADTKISILNKKSTNASEIIEKITTEGVQVVVSNGEFSLWNVIEFILNKYGPAKMWFTTWALSDFTARKFCDWLAKGQLLSIKGILDYRAKNHHEAAYHLAKMNFTEVKTERCHAKVCILKGDGFDICITGSSNFTENPRIEVNVMMDNKEIADKHIEWIQFVLKNGYEFD